MDGPLDEAGRLCGTRHHRAAHSANFDEKVHKPQSNLKLYIGAKMQLVSYEFEYFYQCIMTY